MTPQSDGGSVLPSGPGIMADVESVNPARSAAADSTTAVEPPWQKRIRQQRSAQRLYRYEEVISLLEQENNIRQIARQTGMERRTVARHLYSFTLREIVQRRKVPSILNRFESYLLVHWRAGRHDALHLYWEICQQGHTWSRPLVSRWAVQLRQSGGCADCDPGRVAR